MKKILIGLLIAVLIASAIFGIFQLVDKSDFKQSEEICTGDCCNHDLNAVTEGEVLGNCPDCGGTGYGRCASSVEGVSAPCKGNGFGYTFACNYARYFIDIATCPNCYAGNTPVSINDLSNSDFGMTKAEMDALNVVERETLFRTYLECNYPDSIGSGLDSSLDCSNCNGTGSISLNSSFEVGLFDVQAISLNEGDSAELNVSVELSNGTTTGFSYQWYNGDTAITGETSDVLDLSDLAVGTHLLKCLVSHDNAPSIYTRVARVDVVEASEITITTQLTGKTVAQYANSNVTMEAETTNSIDKVFYTWFLDDEEIETTTRNTFNLAGLSVGTHEVYAVVSSDNAEDVTSAVVDVVVTQNLEIVITVQPQDMSIVKGDDGEITVNSNLAQGISAVYQWYANDVAVEGANSQKLDVSKFDEGEYVVQCKITTEDNEYLTEPASLNVSGNVEAELDLSEYKYVFIIVAIGMSLALIALAVFKRR